MTRPKITKEEVLELVRKQGFDIKEKVFVVALRGYYKDTMGAKGKNDIGIYDDAMILIGPEVYETFNANTDPSKDRPGMATLLPGLHYFKRGKHGITRPGGGYAAFTPATPDDSLPVRRSGKVGVFRGVKINLHSGGEFTTSSEGCQTVIKIQWPEFQPKIYMYMDLYDQDLLPYVLIEM